MGGAMAAKMSGPPKKKKPSFADAVSGGDDGDQTVDATGADEVSDLDADVSSSPVNADTEASAGAMKDEGEGGELGSYDAVEDDAASELASLAGVPEENQAAFKSALSDYVAACIRKQGK